MSTRHNTWWLKLQNWNRCQKLEDKLLSSFIDQSETSENGLVLLSLWREFEMSVANMFLQKADQRRLTWDHPTGKGAVLVFLLRKRSIEIFLTDIRTSRKADVNSDHCLVTSIVNSLWRTRQRRIGLDQIRIKNEIYKNRLENELPVDPFSTTHEGILSS